MLLALSWGQRIAQVLHRKFIGISRMALCSMTPDLELSRCLDGSEPKDIGRHPCRILTTMFVDVTIQVWMVGGVRLTHYGPERLRTVMQSQIQRQCLIARVWP